MGLGTYPEVSIAEARQMGLEARKQIKRGEDPIDARVATRAQIRNAAKGTTFADAARAVHVDLTKGWANQRHIDEWIGSLERYVCGAIGSRRVETLEAADFAAVLRPIWTEKYETASRVKQRCHRVMQWCQAHKLVQGNPLDVVDDLLGAQPSKRIRVQHQPAVPWRLLPDFVREHLRGGPASVTRDLLEFVILTGARSGEARGMTWDEVDLQGEVWTLPKERMKGKQPHRVPLSKGALEILAARTALRSESPYVFPSPRGLMLSDMALTKFLRDRDVASDQAGRTATVHGFRSSFRDWASERGYARDLAERALAHAIRSETEAAYHRTDLLEQRRAMMNAWAQYITGAA
jgi:integrase